MIGMTAPINGISMRQCVPIVNMTSSVLRSPERVINITPWRTEQIMDEQHTISEIASYVVVTVQISSSW